MIFYQSKHLESRFLSLFFFFSTRKRVCPKLHCWFGFLIYSKYSIEIFLQCTRLCLLDYLICAYCLLITELWMAKTQEYCSMDAIFSDIQKTTISMGEFLFEFHFLWRFAILFNREINFVLILIVEESRKNLFENKIFTNIRIPKSHNFFDQKANRHVN